MFVALSVDRDIDLSLFTGYLRQTGIRHRISEDGDQQVVRVYDEVDIAAVQALYEQLARGEVKLERREVPEAERPRPYPSLLQRMWLVPLTTALVLVNIALYPLDNQPAPGRRRRLVTTIVMPDDRT